MKIKKRLKITKELLRSDEYEVECRIESAERSLARLCKRFDFKKASISISHIPLESIPYGTGPDVQKILFEIDRIESIIQAAEKIIGRSIETCYEISKRYKEI